MNIEAHVIAFNEAETIHLTIKWYQKFCSHIIIHDNFSDDGTREIAKSMGCTVKTFGKPGELSDRAYQELKNECFKKKHNGHDHRDYVIIVDADEILQLPDWLEQGPKYPSIFKIQGWNVFSHDMPVNDWFDITNGHLDGNYSKTVIFDPKRITDINFSIGAHASRPKGNVIWSDSTLYLFHYRNVGGPKRLIDRHRLYRPRMSKENIERNFGHHYLMSDIERIAEWESKYQKSKPFSEAILRP